MEIAVPDHVIFFSGYLDAVGRALTNDKILCTLNISLISQGETAEEAYDIKITESKTVSNMVENFEKSVSRVLNTNPQERLLFYMTEYFSWFEEYTNSCHCTSLKITGAKVPSKYLCYSLSVNDSFNIFLLICVSEKYKKPNKENPHGKT